MPEDSAPYNATLSIDGRSATLTADNRARFRFQETGGRFHELLSATEGYSHSIKALHACLDPETRARYAEPIDLCDHVDPLDHAIWEPLFTAIAAARWVKSAEEIMADLEKAAAELDRPEAEAEPEEKS